MIEGYYLESTDGLLFAVKGLVHPPEAVVAYLRYAPDPNGERSRRGLPYRRLYHFGEQEELLRERCPACLFFDPIFGERLQGVPRERVRLVYDPCLKLAELRRREGLDELEEKAVEFADLLTGRAKVSERSIGISGSILVGLHTPHSDLDVVVYGSENCRAVHGALQELLDEPGGEVRRLNNEEMRELHASRSQDTPMSFKDFARLEGRKVIQGKFRGGDYFIRFVKNPMEVRESYGDRRYTSLGQAEIEATVTDASEAIFTPCTYRVEDVRFKAPPQSPPTPLSPPSRSQVSGRRSQVAREPKVNDNSPKSEFRIPQSEFRTGELVSDLREITSFRGRFCEQTEEGERILAQGKLERVVAPKGEIYHRLLLGGQGDSMTVKVG